MVLIVRPSFVMLALALTGTLACRSVPAPAEGLLPLGPGPQMQLGIKGVANGAPSLAARDSFVAIAWSAGAPGGQGDVYVVTSTDAGATFSKPVNVGATVVDAERSPYVVFEWPRLDAKKQFVMPDMSVEWTFRERDRVVERAARSTDGGRTFVRDPDETVHLFYTGGPEVSSRAIDRVIGADPERVSVAHPQAVQQDDGTVAVTWDEAHGDGRRVMLRRALLGADGAVQTIDALPLSASASAIAPVMGNLPGGVIVAWIDGPPSSSTIAIRRVGLDPLCATPPPRLHEEGSHLGHP